MGFLDYMDFNFQDGLNCIFLKNKHDFAKQTAEFGCFVELVVKYLIRTRGKAV